MAGSYLSVWPPTFSNLPGEVVWKYVTRYRPFMPIAVSFWKVFFFSIRAFTAECRRVIHCVMMTASPPFWPSSAQKFSTAGASGLRSLT